MQNHTEPSTPRREFLGQIAVSALTLASTACTVSAANPQTAATPAATPTPRRPREPQKWDDSWFARLSAKHKAVFDMPEVDDGTAIYHASMWIQGTRDALHAAPADIQAVIVIRHAAVILAFNDAMWAKYDLGKERKVKDDATGKWAVRNPYASPPPRDVNAPAPAAGESDEAPSDLASLARNGHILLACNLATQGMASIIAKKVKGEHDAIYQELKANLVPGVILQPSGIYALHRAQEAQCTFSS